MTQQNDSAERLAAHFAALTDRQDTGRLDETEQRARSRELDRLMDKQEHLELVALADQLEQALHNMAKLFRSAGFYLPLIDNIKRDDETAVTFVCAGEQYRLLGSPSFRSTPTRLNFEARGIADRDTGERGWQHIRRTGLLPGPDGDAILVRQTMEYFFEKATEKLVPAARERLNIFLHGLPPAAAPPVMP